MMDEYIVKFDVSKTELEEIENWLKSDLLASKNGRGFYQNWNSILQAFSEKKIAIIKTENNVIGYSIWSERDICVIIDIFEIKSTYREKGIGKYFFGELSEKLKTENFLVIRLFCEPKESEKFWKKMNFIKFPTTHYSIPELTYFKPLIDINKFQKNIDPENKLELWDLEPYKIKDSKPKWTWNINYENFAPIIHPCNSNWNIRLTKNGYIIREEKVKYFSKTEIEFDYFIYIKEFIE